MLGGSSRVDGVSRIRTLACFEVDLDVAAPRSSAWRTNLISDNMNFNFYDIPVSLQSVERRRQRHSLSTSPARSDSRALPARDVRALDQSL